MKIRKQGDVIHWANFKYERLPTFCFFCGIIGHSDRFCEIFFDFPDKNIEKLFRSWLRASSRRNNYTGGEKWLRTGPVVEDGGGEGRGEKMVVDKESTKVSGHDLNHANVHQTVFRNERYEGGNLAFLVDTADQARDGKALNEEDCTNVLDVMDSKRRRMTSGLEKEGGLQDTALMEVGLEGRDVGRTKNGQGEISLVEAGSAMQARQAL